MFLAIMGKYRPVLVMVVQIILLALGIVLNGNTKKHVNSDCHRCHFFIVSGVSLVLWLV